MRIKFDIKYRPQIESGEYKVETRDGSPVRILCWDRKCGYPIVGLAYHKEKGYEYYVNAHIDGTTSIDEDDLFIVTPEEELSEYERIRKELLAYFHDLQLRSDANFSPSYTIDDILDWLERQKEPRFIKRNALFDKCVENCDPDVMKSVSDEVDKMLEKEQKPIPTEDEKTLLENEVKAFLCNYDKEFDDDAPTYDIAEHFYQLGRNSQKPAEWGEEDEHYFQNLIMAVDSTFSDGNTKNWLLNRLKSLRPQHHCKPSEYTLLLLKKVADGGMLTCLEQMAVGTIYEQLKKL